jgi:hypothetical protein
LRLVHQATKVPPPKKQNYNFNQIKKNFGLPFGLLDSFPLFFNGSLKIRFQSSDLNFEFPQFFRFVCCHHYRNTDATAYRMSFAPKMDTISPRVSMEISAPRSYTISTGRALSTSAQYGQVPPNSAISVTANPGAQIAAALHQETERANLENRRAEAAENRLLRSMAHFSALRSQLSSITAKQNSSASVVCVESRNEIGELAAWTEFLTTSPKHFLRAELRNPLTRAVLKRNEKRFEIVVPLLEGGSLGFKISPDLFITEANRENIECHEGYKIVAVDGVELSSVDDLRASLKGKQVITMTMEPGGQLIKVIRRNSLFWEVASIPCSTSIEGDLKIGDLILRVNSAPVATWIDAHTILENTSVEVEYIPGASKVAKRIRKEGLMSFSTKVSTYSHD